MQDIRRLVQERQTEIQNYQQNPAPLTNPALFRARAKFIELCLLLGVAGEHLLKAILLKNGFIVNEEVNKMATTQFRQNLLNRIRILGNRPDQQELDAIHNSAAAFMGQVSGKTISFAQCISLFYTRIVSSPRSYFSNLPNKRYNVTNQETRNFFGRTVNTTNALKKIKKLRNNYAHLPEPMYEERGLIPFLYNFLVFISKKEFPAEMANLQTI